LVLVNEDRLCHIVNTPITHARFHENARIENLAKGTKLQFSHLLSEDIFKTQVRAVDNGGRAVGLRGLSPHS
jgi:hypothetical protein